MTKPHGVKHEWSIVRMAVAMALFLTVLCAPGCGPAYRTRMEELDSETWYEVPELRMPQPGEPVAEPEDSPSESPALPLESARPDSAGTRSEDAGSQTDE